MRQEVYDLIDRSKYHQQAIREIIALLPAEDAELDEWISEAIRSSHLTRFVFIMLAALAAERVVSARHLELGAPLIPNYTLVGAFSWRMQGEVAEHLMAALRNVTISYDIRASALLTICAWCLEYREGRFPEGLLTNARLLAREKELTHEAAAMLLTLADLAGDDSIEEILLVRRWNRPEADRKDEAFQPLKDAALKVGRSILEHFRSPILEMLPATSPAQLASGFTMRRAVARTGRNEPCPCGSGQKYKRCCFEKDQERLHHSTDVAGKTSAEVQANPEEHLTEARLEKTSPHELARMNPLKIAPDLLQTYFVRLSVFMMFDHVVKAFVALGGVHEREDIWHFAQFFATRGERKEAAERLLQINGVNEKMIEELRPGTQLLLARDDPGETLRLLNDLSLKALQTVDDEQLSRFAYGLLVGSHRALGIFVARSMVASIGKTDALFLFDQIQEARVRLNLPHDDPFSDIIDARFTKEVAGSGKEAEKLRAAQKRLQAKAAEARQLQESLETLKREIERREKKQETPALAVSAAPTEPRYTLQELREKVSSLKSVLRERNEERSTLRRELGQAHSALETLRQKEAQPTPGPGATRDDEDHLLLPGEMSSQQPVRILEFPRKFHATLTGFPQNVARAAITMLGRLAAGEQAAFVGVVRLKDCPNVLRQRIGIDHRLLFRLHADHVEVVDLINRKDLERRIKTL
jgi:hypothetical protein